LVELFIPGVIEKLGVGQGGSSDFSTGTMDIARGKDRSEDEKYEVKPTQIKTNFSITSGIPPHNTTRLLHQALGSGLAHQKNKY
jgi:hypothetical protein